MARDFMARSGSLIRNWGRRKDFYVLYAVDLFNKLLDKVIDPVSVFGNFQKCLDDLIILLYECDHSTLDADCKKFVDELLALLRSPGAASYLQNRHAVISG